jgi:hypothetical protein
MNKQKIKRVFALILSVLFILPLITLPAAFPAEATTPVVIHTAFIDFNIHGGPWTDGEAPAGRVAGNGLSVSHVGDADENPMRQRGGSWGMERNDFIFVFVDDPVLKTASRLELEIEYWRTTSPNSFDVQYVSSGDPFRRIQLRTAAGERADNSWNTARATLANCLFTEGHNQGAQFRIESNGVIVKSIRVTGTPPSQDELAEIAENEPQWDLIKAQNAEKGLAFAFIDFNRHGGPWTEGEPPPDRVTGDGISVSRQGDGSPNAMVRQGGRWGMRRNDFIYVFIDDPALKDISGIELEIEYWRTGNNNSLNVQYVSVTYDFMRVTANRTTEALGNNAWNTAGVTLSNCDFQRGHNQDAQFRIESPDNIIVKSIRLTEAELSDGEWVKNMREALIWDNIRNANASEDLIMENLNLPVSGAGGTSISWQSGKPEIISPNGAVNRPVHSERVTLTATISKGSETTTKEFVLTVRGSGANITDGQAVANAAGALSWDMIKRGNISQDIVVTDLYLPPTGVNYTDISWSSNASSVISGGGIVNRPQAAPANVTLTATITRGTAAQTVGFDLTVPARSDIAANVRPPIQTLYPSKDYVVADYAVTDFGAKTTEQAEREGLAGFCNRTAFQNAIDTAYENSGGVVFIPAGHYAFYTAAAASTTVTTSYITGSRETFPYERVLDLRTGVQLRGDWADPEEHGGKVLGTVLEVYAGKNSPNHDGYAKGQRVDPQAGNAVRDTYISIADRFIDMAQGTGVTNLSIWYPEQTLENGRAVPFPWTLYQRGGNSATVENVTLVNSYGGFYSSPSELHYVVNSYMTALKTAIQVHICTDIGRLENIKISPKYWADSGLPGAPPPEEVRAWTRANASGFRMHRSDWEYVSHLYISGYKTGIWVGKEPGYSDTPNAQFYEIHIDDCEVAFEIEDVNPYGLLISNSSFAGDTAVYFDNDFHTSVQFSGVDFKGPVVSDGRGGVISFESCTFDDSLKINRGNVLLGQSSFATPDNHVYLGENVGTLRSLNSGYNRVLDITNNSRNATVDIITGDEYIFEPIPKNIQTNIAAQPKAAQGLVFRADLPRRTGNNNTMPNADVSAELQNALDHMAGLGGGIVYLPSGRYLVNNPVIVPTGVELRGSWDVQHHTVGGGTIIITNYAGTGGGAGDPLIQLQERAGVRGLSVAQDNIGVVYGPSFRPGNTGEYVIEALETPYLIQGQGADVYIINVNIPYGDKGVDLATYKTDRHYVDYLSGQLARVGVLAGGGADGGFIRNIQFNPHYGLRFPPGGQSIRRVSLYEYQIYNYSAIKFGDVRNQTVFNNFVFGAQYGIHFAKDEANGNMPGEIIVIGHGTDGGTFGMYVQDGGENTKITLINSELVAMVTPTSHRAYVMMGDFENPDSVHPDALLVMYNSALWGGPTESVIIQNGTVRMQQTNFSAPGRIGVLVFGGSAHVYNSYFQSAVRHAVIEDGAKSSVELTNNYYTGNLRYETSIISGIYGSDPNPADVVPAAAFEITDGQLVISNLIGATLNGTIRLIAPSNYAADFTRVRFNTVAPGESLALDLPCYQSDLLVFEVRIFGRKYTFESLFDPINSDEEIITGSAREAVAKALETKSETDIDMAYNFVAIVKNGDIRAELRNLLDPPVEEDDEIVGRDDPGAPETPDNGGGMFTYILMLIVLPVIALIVAGGLILKNKKSKR